MTPPIQEFICTDCGHVFEQYGPYTPPEEKVMCVHCDTYTAEKLPSCIGGYHGNMGSGSTRPRGAGSMKQVKRPSPKAGK
jgi:hypothetical protein